MSPNQCSLVAVTTALLYTSQNLLPPSRPPRQQGLADLLLLLRETSITGNTFSTSPKPIMVKWDSVAGQEQHLLPCKSESVLRVLWQGKVEGSHLQVMCFHKAVERSCTYMVWSLFIARSFYWTTADSLPSAEVKLRVYLFKNVGFKSLGSSVSVMILSTVYKQHKLECEGVGFSFLCRRCAENISNQRRNLRTFNFKLLRGLDIVRWTWQLATLKGCIL